MDRNPRLKQIKTGRILDTEKQVEILFSPEKVNLCAGMSNSYKIIGIPDTHIVFEDEIEKGDTLIPLHHFHPPSSTRNMKTKVTW